MGKRRDTSNDKLINITIHTKNDADMKQFLELAKDFSAIKRTKPKQKKQKTDTFEGCDWKEMPEFNVATIRYEETTVRFSNITEAFEKWLRETLKLKITQGFTWFPEFPAEIKDANDYSWTAPLVQNKYPIFILSYRRPDEQKTHAYLDWIGLPYQVVIEPEDLEDYALYIDRTKLVVMPHSWKLKQLAKGNGGGIPARNYILQLAREMGAKRHWVLDDNIHNYVRSEGSKRLTMKCNPFRPVEDFVDRYSNIAVAGHNYKNFCVDTTRVKPIRWNTRIFSSILRLTDDEEWEGVYNEDLDLSIRYLKKGLVSAEFQTLLADKTTTGRSKGGNTDTIYKVGDAKSEALYQAKLAKAMAIKLKHPDLPIEIIPQFKDPVPHHKINLCEIFKQPAIMFEAVKMTLSDRPNNYGMTLVPKENRMSLKKPYIDKLKKSL
jgi:hypothetical protein